MKLKQIVISIENSPGRLLEVADALGKAGINLRALNLVDTGAFGQLRLLVSDVARARQILMKMHISAFVNEVVAAEIDDAPGSLAKLLRPLRDANINVIYMYAFIGSTAAKAIMIFRFSDNDLAIEVLKKGGYRLLDADAFGILENER
ncbi:MAG: amino acid-binding protein [Desulfobacterales bacterium]